jgi:hypothetical protein
VDAAVLVGVTLVLLVFIYRQRRSALRSFRMWLFCEGLPIGLAVLGVLAAIWLLLGLASL